MRDLFLMSGDFNGVDRVTRVTPSPSPAVPGRPWEPPDWWQETTQPVETPAPAPILTPAEPEPAAEEPIPTVPDPQPINPADDWDALVESLSPEPAPKPKPKTARRPRLTVEEKAAREAAREAAKLLEREAKAQAKQEAKLAEKAEAERLKRDAAQPRHPVTGQTLREWMDSGLSSDAWSQSWVAHREAINPPIQPDGRGQMSLAGTGVQTFGPKALASLWDRLALGDATPDDSPILTPDQFAADLGFTPLPLPRE